MKKVYLYRVVILAGLFIIAFIICQHSSAVTCKAAVATPGLQPVLSFTNQADITFTTFFADNNEDDFINRHVPKSKVLFNHAILSDHLRFMLASNPPIHPVHSKIISSKLVLNSVFRI